MHCKLLGKGLVHRLQIDVLHRALQMIRNIHNNAIILTDHNCRCRILVVGNLNLRTYAIANNALVTIATLRAVPGTGSEIMRLEVGQT